MRPPGTKPNFKFVSRVHHRKKLQVSGMIPCISSCSLKTTDGGKQTSAALKKTGPTTIEAVCFNAEHSKEGAEKASWKTLFLKKVMNLHLLSYQGHNMTLRGILSVVLKVIAGLIPDQGECCGEQLRRIVWFPNAALWHDAFDRSITASHPCHPRWVGELKEKTGISSWMNSNSAIQAVGNSGEWVQACGVVPGHRVTHKEVFERRTEAE